MKLAPRIFFTLLVFVVNTFAAEIRFDSGFPKLISEKIVTRSLNTSDAISEFLENEFSRISPFEWKISKRQEDETHIHFTFDLVFENHPVFFQHLKIHWNKEGFIDYVTNTLRKAISVPNRPQRVSWEELKDSLTQALYKKTRFEGTAKGTLGLWLNEDQSQAFWAFDIQAVPGRGGVLKRGIVSVETRELLEEKKIMRHWEGRPNEIVKAFPSLPRTKNSIPPNEDKYNFSDAEPMTVVVREAGILKDTVSWVRFDRPNGMNYTDIGSTNSINFTVPEEDTYSADCTATIGTCSNQKLDGGNVFYHLKRYRSWLDDQAETFNATLQFAYDPIPSLVNFMGFSIQEDSEGNPVSATSQSNNAAYIGTRCASDGSMERCLVFLRPRASPCELGGDNKNWFSLAREALVIAHEYQHYVTDMISGIEFGSVGGITVADVLHEGYSDYLGASYVTWNDSGKTDTYVIGAYGFQHCENLKRNLSSNSVFNPDFAYVSPHRPGLVWASGLWELRSSLGPSTVDQIALKSLYFLSTSPGFIDSIEALIQADRSITGGLNETRIRTLFYDERKFIGSLTGAFQDGDKKILKVGFQGCANVEQAENPSSKVSYAVLLLWLLGTLALPKMRRSLKEPS